MIPRRLDIDARPASYTPTQRSYMLALSQQRPARLHRDWSERMTPVVVLLAAVAFALAFAPIGVLEHLARFVEGATR